MPNPVLTRLDKFWIEEHVKLHSPGALVLFDIDSTIMNTSPRNFAILEEAAREFSFLEGLPEKMSPEQMGWNICDDVQKIRPLAKDQAYLLYDFWKRRFFFEPWIDYDIPYRGIRELLHWLHGYCKIVYLTGRDSPYMGKATIASFIKHDLPHDEKTKFIFKPSQDVPDLLFKQGVFEQVKTLGQVVLAIENEPANANAMKEAFPDAEVGLIQTITAPNPAIPREDIFIFSDYWEASSF